MDQLMLRRDYFYDGADHVIMLKEHYDYFIMQTYEGPRGLIYMCYCPNYPYPVLIPYNQVRIIVRTLTVQR